MSSLRSKGARGLSGYIAVTAAYWAFMLTDGALRMLVLLHFNSLGFTPIQLAYLFVVYEFAGIVTNLCAGWLAARFGLTSTLYAGLTLQVLALLALTQLDASWTITLSVAFVMAVQGLSGVAKDLAKMSAKSAVKLLAPDASSSLFRWVALLTGSKNAVKGVGFFVGAVMLSLFGFAASLLAMAAVLTAVLIVIVLAMPREMPPGQKRAKFSDVFSKNSNINWLSIARVFLFGARDIWFVVGVPIYFYSVLSDGSAEGSRQAFFIVGSFMACWIILYGAIQANAPKLLNAKEKSHTELLRAGWRWILRLGAVALTLALLALLVDTSAVWFTLVLIAGLLVFGALFALNSALHSYMILAFSSNERVTLDVGFYYMANAAGRLAGTVLSGMTFQLGGLPLCLGLAGAFVFLSAFSFKKIRAQHA